MAPVAANQQLKHFCGEKIKRFDLAGSQRTGEDAGARGEEPQQHRGQPLAETGDGGIRLQPRQYCEYYSSDFSPLNMSAFM